LELPGRRAVIYFRLRPRIWRLRTYSNQGEFILLTKPIEMTNPPSTGSAVESVC
jgi:hypothetical protein